MNLMVPTLMCKAMAAIEFQALGRTVKPGEVIDLAYGQALVMKAMGGITAIVDEDAKHIEAQDQLAMYGGDCWFPHRQQTISRVADYLAAANLQTNTVN